MKKIGFARMKESDPARLLELASEGGRTVHAKGRAHVFTEEERSKGSERGVEQRQAGRRARSAEARTMPLFPEAS